VAAPRRAPSPQEVPVPSRQRVRADEEAPPPVSGQVPGRRRQEGPIGRGQQSPPSLAAEDRLGTASRFGSDQMVWPGVIEPAIQAISSRRRS
jgi:hypothetical protein